MHWYGREVKVSKCESMKIRSSCFGRLGNVKIQLEVILGGGKLCRCKSCGCWGGEWKSTDLDWEKARTCIVAKRGKDNSANYIFHTSRHRLLFHIAHQIIFMWLICWISMLKPKRKVNIKNIQEMLQPFSLIFLDGNWKANTGQPTCFEVILLCSLWVDLADLSNPAPEAGQLFLWPSYCSEEHPASAFPCR